MCPGLTENQTIRRGQPIATAGSPGKADLTAPHLHFAIVRTTPDASRLEPATAIDPYPLMTGRL